MIKKLFKTIGLPNEAERLAKLRNSFLKSEAKVGGKLFGPLPKGHRREFFCLDEHTWVWHEEWLDSNGHRQILTTRYDIRSNGILKAQGNQPYRYATTEEALNLYEAAKLYKQRVKQEIYSFV